MKHIITSLVLIFMSQIAFGQKYDELKILFADEDYKKLVAKAIKITMKDDRKKEIPPYIWIAKGLHKIHLSGDPDPKYKKAYGDAIKYLGKGIKLDIKINDGATINSEEYKEFIEMFQMTLYTRITNEFEAQLPKKAYSWALKYVKITEHKVGAKYLAGACKLLDSDPGTARVLMNEGEALLKEVTSIDGWSEGDKNMLMMGIIYSAQVYKSKRQPDKAKALMNKVAQFFEGNEIWDAAYEANGL